MALMYCVGGLTTLLVVAVPHQSTMYEPVAFVIGVLSPVVAAVIQLQRERLPTWANPWLLTTGTAIVTTLVAAGGGGTASVSLSCFYIWIVMYALLFFSPLVAAAQIAAVVSAYGAVLAWLAASTAGHVTAAEPVVLMSVIATISIVVLRLSANLRRHATTDDLTGLSNRRAFYADVHDRLTAAQHQHKALLLLDLNRFKEVNDSLGHHLGDRLLIQVGARLREHLRDGDLLARLGGDEFAILLEAADHHVPVAVAVKLRAALGEPFALEGIAVRTGVSIGISLFPEHGRDLSTLLRRADIAMYKAKGVHEGHHLYSGADDVDGAARLQTLQELETALVGDQLVLHYQPKIDLQTGEVHGVEALVRWDHPTRGLLYPDAFLGLIEEAGLMPTMTQVVLEQALDQAATWHRQGRRLTVAVNLSASSLIDANLPEKVVALLADRGLPAHALQLEITEEFLMVDRERAHAILTRLRRGGIQIAVDDFGTGYSSLAYLRDLPIDELKLDRSFIFPMADDARAAALVASTVALAHSLGLRMVAEGVENHVAYTELTRLGCDQAQGYHMSRPVPAAELEHWLHQRSAVLAHRPPPSPAAAPSPAQTSQQDILADKAVTAEGPSTTP
jgi:diguanylate cyclase (GGDEF)-like protein